MIGPSDLSDTTSYGRYPFPLEHVSEVRVLLVGQILERVNVALVISLPDTCSRSGIALSVQTLEVESEEDDDQKQQNVAAHVRAEGDEVAGCVGVAENLWAFLRC